MDGPTDIGGEVVISRGVRFPIEKQVLPRRLRRVLRTNQYEVAQSEAALDVIDEGDRVLELGAGLGYMSTLIATKKNPSHLTCYEANPKLIPYIERVHAANGVETIALHNALLTSRKGTPLPFYLRENGLSSSMTLEDDPDSVVDTVHVEQHGIGPVLRKVKPDVLLCDIQGAEAQVLPAGKWEGLRAAVIKLHPQWIGQKGVQAVFDAMQGPGLTYAPNFSNGQVVTFRKGW